MKKESKLEQLYELIFPRVWKTKINIASLKTPRGQIGSQGATTEQIRDILGAIGLKFDASASMKEMINAVRSNSEAKHRLIEFMDKNPIEVIKLPDGSVSIRDGNNRAFLMYHIGEEQIPVIIKQ